MPTETSSEPLPFSTVSRTPSFYVGAAQSSSTRRFSAGALVCLLLTFLKFYFVTSSLHGLPTEGPGYISAASSLPGLPIVHNPHPTETMGNSFSTVQVYNENIDENVKEEISDTGDEFFASLFTPETLSSQTAALLGLVDDVTDILPFKQTVAGDTIDDQMRRGADMVFAKSFDYLYSDQPDQCHPPGAIGLPTVTSSLCSISTPVGNQVTEYIQSGPFSKLDLPTWVKRQATVDLIYTVTKLVNDNAKPTWGFVPLNQKYNSTVGDQDDWRCNVIFLYVTGALTNDGLRAGFSMVYYLGAFFRVQSDTKGPRDSTLRNAYTPVAQYLGVATPTTDQELLDILRRSGIEHFLMWFGFPLGSVPPDSLYAEGVSSAYLKSNELDQTIPVANFNRDYLKTVLEQGLFSGLDVPIASIKEKALESFTNLLLQVVADAPLITLFITSIDELYMPADPTLNPIRHKSVILAPETTWEISAGEMVTVVYTIIQAMFYEEVPAEQRAVKRLFQILCDKLFVELQRPPQPGADLLSLKGMLFEYAGQKFGTNFGFAYNGNQTNPPDLRPGGAVRGYEELFHISHSPAAVQEVEDWLNAEVFLKDSLTFPAFANNKIWEKIRDDVVEFAGATTAENWLHEFNSALYLDPGGGTNIKQYSQYVYAVGELELDGVKVTRVFVCYLGVFCGTTQTI